MDEDLCPICLDTLDSRKECVTLKCNHKFHKKCIKLWFKQKQICPYCRMPHYEFYKASQVSFPYFRQKIYFDDEHLTVKTRRKTMTFSYKLIIKILIYKRYASLEVKNEQTDETELVKFLFKKSEITGYFFTNLKNKLLGLV